jgi:Na+-translocating ferredoxin:NAD+ oxidoreductase subunit B
LGAIKRTYVEDPYYEYTIDEPLCIGCGKCVKGCYSFGNGSLFLQVRHDRCLNCNDCSIARGCPSGAFRRVPANSPYLFKGVEQKA